MLQDILHGHGSGGRNNKIKAKARGKGLVCTIALVVVEAIMAMVGAQKAASPFSFSAPSGS